METPLEHILYWAEAKKDQYSALLYEVKENRDNNIDFSKSFTNITK